MFLVFALSCVVDDADDTTASDESDTDTDTDTDSDADADTDADADSDTDADTDTDLVTCTPAIPANDGLASVVLDGADAEFAGTSVAVADLDGDGTDDLLVGSPYTTIGYVVEGGRVWLDYGPVTTSGDLSVVADAWFDSEGSASRLGSQLGVLGDINADGLVDVGTLADQWPYDGIGAIGRASFLYGDPVRHAGAAVISTWDAHLEGGGIGRMGHGVVGIGDLDADGFDDVAVAEPFFDTDVGHIYIVPGRDVWPAQDLPRESMPFINGIEKTKMCWGRCIASDDFDGDGLIDLAIAAERNDTGLSIGMVAMRYGDGTRPSNEDAGSYPRLEYDEASGNGYFGTATTAIGDLDGDGLGDLAIGEFTNSEATVNGGRVWVLRGDTTRWTDTADLATTSWMTIEGVQSSGMVGAAIAKLGDLDCDGRGDMAVGSPGLDGQQLRSGAVSFWLAPTGGTVRVADATATLLGGISDQGFGAALAVGDLDGNQLPDLAVGAPDYSGNDGRVYLFTDLSQ